MESLRKWADVLAKLAGAVAIAGVTWFVAGLESTMSSIDLLAKREEAETRLRASMFTALVDPVLGPRSEGEAPDANRQRLLAELLTLNFHDHIEFKPLLIHVDALVANDADSSDPDRSRGSLRSVARRVIDRQVNALSAAANSMNLPWTVPIDMYFENVDATERSPRLDCVEASLDDMAQLFEGVCQESTDGRYQLKIYLTDMNVKDATADVYLEIYEKGDSEPVNWSNFTLTHYDFPLTDNAQIDPNYRYSLVLYEIDPFERYLRLKLIWFPEGYVTPQERPVDYLRMREALGLNRERSSWRARFGLE